MDQPIAKFMQFLVFQYCTEHGLQFYPRKALDVMAGDAEEWEGVLCAGMDDFGTAFIIQEEDGRVKVIGRYADGISLMEDEWRYLTEDELRSGKRLHEV